MAHVESAGSQAEVQSVEDQEAQSWQSLAPAFHHADFPWRQIFGYIASLILTFGAFLLVVNHVIPTAALIAVILALAGLQAALQLGLFMHIRESVGPTWHVLSLSLGIAVALGIVAFSVWIVSFHWGVS